MSSGLRLVARPPYTRSHTRSTITFFVADEPAVLDAQHGRYRPGLAAEPADELLPDACRPPRGRTPGRRRHVRPGPEDAVVVVVVLGEIVGEHLAV